MQGSLDAGFDGGGNSASAMSLRVIGFSGPSVTTFHPSIEWAHIAVVRELCMRYSFGMRQLAADASRHHDKDEVGSTDRRRIKDREMH